MGVGGGNESCAAGKQLRIPGPEDRVVLIEGAVGADLYQKQPKQSSRVPI